MAILLYAFLNYLASVVTSPDQAITALKKQTST